MKAETLQLGDILEDLKLTKTVINSTSQAPEEADFSVISDGKRPSGICG
jgi:hypothetical protein